ncbi:conserved hypothetical protein [Capnocytophaga cynodegmi]|uniref:Uncharacterized protein n=2 Tax=Capnocytophaga cynodegmi TaxID=28189 RepID=A0A0B7HAD7_9FLAO|nr:conserved hypothetical protein [Capnocytophaga cynodegmi]
MITAMKTLEKHNIRTKKQIVSLYINQYSEKNIKKYINEIICDYRKNAKNCKNISTQEALTFIELYGTPDGYVLSEELKKEINNRKLKV